MPAKLARSASVNIDPAIFNTIFFPHLNNMARTQIFYGGSSSGKSVFIAQRCIYDLLRGGRNYLVCRQVARTMKTSVFSQVCRIIDEWSVRKFFRISKTDFTITCSNGYQTVFVGLDDVEKIKSITPSIGAWTDIWIEEATELNSIDTLKQLRKRQRGGDPNVSKRLVMSFNPILRLHWIFNEFFVPIGWSDIQTEYVSEDLSILKTWYIHNRFLTPDDIKDLENEKDRYYYNVYTLGNWGVLGHIVFTNWKVADLSKMHNQFLNPHHGLDFGFSNDPAAMGNTHYDQAKKTIYFYDELYETGLTNDVLATRIKKKIGRERIMCDSAEPKSIAELRRDGVNAIPALKGRDSIEHGIQWLQQQQIIIDARCINAQNEFAQYHYEEDRNGIISRKPAQRNDHLIDQLRYAYEKESRGGLRKASSHQG